jgi:hypothetical protein
VINVNAVPISTSYAAEASGLVKEFTEKGMRDSHREAKPAIAQIRVLDMGSAR